MKMHIGSVIVALGALFVQQCLYSSALADNFLALKSTGKARAVPNPAPWVNFSGQWSTQTSSGKNLTMNLTQSGNSVSGSYVGGGIGGNMGGNILPDGKLDFTWQQSDGSVGKGVFSPVADMSTFQGSWVCIVPPGGGGGTWNGTKLTGVGVVPPGGTSNFNLGGLTQPPQAQAFPVMQATGNPDLDTALTANEKVYQMNRGFAGGWGVQAHGGGYFAIEFTQIGNTVTGKYSPYNGKIEGNLERDGRLVYRWSDERGPSGAGIFAIYNGNWLVGTYGTSQNATEVAGCWGGKRLTAYTPPVKPPVAQVLPVLPRMPIYQAQNARFEQLRQLNRLFHGKWVVKEKSSGTEFTINLSQNGNSVTGTYQPQNGKIDGTMANDGLLTYRWSDDSGSSGVGTFVIYEGVQLVGTYSKNQNQFDVSGQWSGGRQ